MCRLRGKGTGGARSFAHHLTRSRSFYRDRSTFHVPFYAVLIQLRSFKIYRPDARGERRKIQCRLFIIYISSPNFSTSYRARVICTLLTNFKNTSQEDLLVFLHRFTYSSRFLHFCPAQASVVVTISLRSEFCTAHREGKRGCPRASLSMAFPYEGGGWIRTPKGEMAHSDALIQRRP